MMTSQALVSVERVSRKYCRDLRRSLRYAASDLVRDLLARPATGPTIRSDEFWALRDVSFEIGPGESLGVMGVNGAGKSTLLRLVLGSLRPTEGRIVTRGRLASLGDHGLGFDPLLTGRENAYLCAAVLQIDRRRVDDALGEIVAFAELEAFIDAPVRSYSDGMRARLGFAVAAFLAPDVLLVDEVLAVGDLGFQRRCIERAKGFLERGGALVLVSHNPHLVHSLCDRCLVLDRGHVVFDGDVVAAVARYFEAVRAGPDDLLARDPALLAGGASPTRRPAPRRELPSDPSGGVVGAEVSPVTIEDFGIRPLGPGALQTGMPARVHVRYRSTRDLQVRWGFTLLTAGLETTISSDGRLDAFGIAAGPGELTATIPRLLLSGGRYALRVSIMDPATGLPFALGGFGSPRLFDVAMPASVGNNYRQLTRAIVTFEDLAWDERGERPAQPAGGRTAVP